MLIYLMQHGVCLSKELDMDEPLSPVGRETVQKSAEAMVRLGLSCEMLLHSPKTRSRQTADILAKALGLPDSMRRETEHVKSMALVEATVSYLRDLGVSSACIAGHMPHIGLLVGHVITGGAKAAVKVENAGLICLEIKDFTPAFGTLVWCLPQKHLHLLGRD